MKLDTRSILFNGAGVLLFAGLGFYIVRSFIVTESMEQCTNRYDTLTEFVLDNGAGPLTPVQLVGTIGASQRGIVRNAKVVKVKGVSSGNALKVALRPDPPGTESGTGNGIGFVWTPRDFKDATAACLSYAVYVPKSFDFGNGGFLPGVFGGRPMTLREASDGKSALAQRVVWRVNGRGNLFAQMPDHDLTRGAYLAQEGFKFPRGRWVRIEKEIVLNDVGKWNGVSRLWIDGEIVASKERLTWRKSKELFLTGVQADIGYGIPQRDVPRPAKPGQLFVSQLELRWR